MKICPGFIFQTFVNFDDKWYSYHESLYYSLTLKYVQDLFFSNNNDHS